MRLGERYQVNNLSFHIRATRLGLGSLLHIIRATDRFSARSIKWPAPAIDWAFLSCIDRVVFGLLFVRSFPARAAGLLGVPLISEQLAPIKERVGAMVRCLTALRERTVKRGFSHDDKLRQATDRAYDAVYALALSCTTQAAILGKWRGDGKAHSAFSSALVVA